MVHTVLITGGASGTGLAIAEKFASEGYAVYITGRNKEKTERSAEMLCKKYASEEIYGCCLAPFNEQDIKDLVEKIESNHHLSALVLNAANLGKDLDNFSCDIKDWGDVIDVNVKWNFMIARAVASKMLKSGGSIVFVSSNTARRAIKGRSAYIASKGGIISLVKALSADWGQYKIRVNALLPGAIKTELWNSHDEKWQEARTKRCALGDIADFSDIAEGVFYLSSDAAKSITGTELIIDGGVDSYMYTEN